MKTIKASNHQEWSGTVDHAPHWVKCMVAPWYRRFLMWPYTIYTVIVGSFTITHTAYYLFAIPGYVLTIFIAFEATKNWYEDRYQEYEDKYPIK